MKRFPLHIWAIIVGSALLFLSGWDLVSSLTEAKLNFQKESHNLALSDEAKLAQRLKWMRSTLDLVASDKVLQTFVAAGGPLPPLAEPRVKPAFELLAQSSEVLSLYVVSFYSPKGEGPLLALHSSQRPKEQFGDEERKQLKALEGTLQEQSSDYLVSESFSLGNEAVFFYAKPLVHRDRPVGLVLCLFRMDELTRGLSPLAQSVEETNSNLVVKLSSVPSQTSTLYHEELYPAPHWQIVLSRADRFFWKRDDVQSAVQTALLQLLLIGLGLFTARALAQRKSALAASKAKSDFMASISHELRTPLNGVLGMTRLALKTDLSPVQEEYLNTVTSSAESVLFLINDLLDLSKIEAEALELTPRPTNPVSSAHRAIKPFQHVAQKKGLELVLYTEKQLPAEISVDPLRLTQILTNLLNNALKFTHRGSVSLEVKTLADGIQWSVRDTGIGIAQDRQAAIFDPFQQADGQIVQEYGGTGLGLSICRELISRMGGRLELESKLGHGSTFQFTLPLEGTGLALSPSQALPSSFSLVEIPPETAKALRKMLREWGLEESQEPAESIVLRAPDVEEKFPEAERVIVLADTPEQLTLSNADSVLLRPINPRALLDTLSGPPEVPEQLKTEPKLGASLKILFVDDSPINQKLGQLLLKEHGHQVELASTGREAVEKASRNDYDLVFMDLHMPEMDGLQASRTLRRAGSKVPIIALTGSTLNSDRENCLAAGMNAHLPKPLDERLMHSTIRSVLQRESEVEEPVRVEPGEAPWEGSVFDANLAIRRVGGDPRNLCRLIGLFEKVMQREFPLLADSSLERDQRRQAGSTLRTAVAPFEASNALQALRTVEDALKNGSSSDPSHYENLERELQRLQKALHRFSKEREE